MRRFTIMYATRGESGEVVAISAVPRRRGLRSNASTFEEAIVHAAKRAWVMRCAHGFTSGCPDHPGSGEVMIADASLYRPSEPGITKRWVPSLIPIPPCWLVLVEDWDGNLVPSTVHLSEEEAEAEAVAHTMRVTRRPAWGAGPGGLVETFGEQAWVYPCPRPCPKQPPEKVG